MSKPVNAAPLLNFAQDFITDIDHHREVRTELLAEEFRKTFGLPAFPSINDLQSLGAALGVKLSSPSMPPGLAGANVWREGSVPQIFLSEDLSRQRAETTYGHELRELIENAFKSVKPSYCGLDTSDNRTMNPESDQFAGCLLMQAEASRAAFREMGFDTTAFSRTIQRSLPSVILRSRQLFPASSNEPGPVMGIWLFEAPWQVVQSGEATLNTMKLRYQAHLSGFSARKHGSRDQQMARQLFPSNGTTAEGCRFAAAAVVARTALLEVLALDLFGERDFIVGTEPFFAGGAPWRVLVTAVRRDGEALVRPWIKRLTSSSRFAVDPQRHTPN